MSTGVVYQFDLVNWSGVGLDVCWQFAGCERVPRGTGAGAVGWREAGCASSRRRRAVSGALMWGLAWVGWLLGASGQARLLEVA